MAAEQRKLLEQLMGEKAMSGASQSRQPQLSITDSKVCRSYLVGTCPHDLFTNTKNDLGPCPNAHSEPLKIEYESASEEQKRRWNFEYDYMRHIGKFIDECNRKIDSAQRHLEKTPEEIKRTNALLKQISDLTESIEIGLQEIEYLGKIGQVNLAVTEHWKLRQLQQQKIDRDRELKAMNDASGPSGHQKLQVCDVCGAYLSRLDNDRRLADHFFGKMHLGYAQMRKKFEQLQKEVASKGPPTGDYYSSGPLGDDRSHGDRNQQSWGGARGGYGGGGGRGFRGGGGWRGGGGGGGYRGRGRY
ncbi:MAG: hypothetical protein Q9159_007365 [Coniocarpon cinnabarinum]